MAELSPCARLVREQHHERFLLTLFAPPAHREILFALFAWFQELTKIYDRISDPVTGLIRLTWWREALAEIEAGRVRQHEVVAGLAAVHHKRPLPISTMQGIIDAMQNEVEKTTPPTFQELENSLRQTSGALYQACLLATSTATPENLRAAEEIGTAYGLILTLKSAPHAFSRQQCLLPADLMQQASISPDHYGGKAFLQGSKHVARTMAERVDHILSGIKTSSLRGDIKWLRLHILLARLYLKKLRRNDNDIFTKPLKLNSARTTLHLALGM